MITFFEIVGLDTVASIYINDKLVASGVDNMFVRYTIPIDKDTILAPLGEKNTISIAFESPVTYSKNEFEKYVNEFGYDIVPDCMVTQTECHTNHIRKMQSSFG